MKRGIDIETLHVDVCSRLPLFEQFQTDAPGAERAADVIQRIRQLATKSGIWFRDVRRPDTLAHAIGGARQALGFAEMLSGDVEAMKRRTRNYARRQLTWMRKLAGVRVLDVTDRAPEDVANAIVYEQLAAPL